MLAVTELASNSINYSASGQGGSFTVRLPHRLGRGQLL
jgi:two-component sensor histidine kinase